MLRDSKKGLETKDVKKKKFSLFRSNSSISASSEKKNFFRARSIPLVGRISSNRDVLASPYLQQQQHPCNEQFVKTPPVLTFQEKVQAPLLIVLLPEELLDYICSFLSHSDFGRFRETCKLVYQRTSCQAKERKLLGVSALLRTNPDNVWLYAIRKSDLEMLNFLKQLYDAPIGEGIVEEAVISYNPEVYTWLAMNYPSTFRDPRLTEKAAMLGNIPAVQAMHKICPSGCTESALNAAVWHGHLKLAKWLDKKHSNLATERTFALSVIAGHLNIMKILYIRHSKFRKSDFVDTMKSLAASKGRNHIIQWLTKAKEFEQAATTATAVVVGGAAMTALFCTIS
jgi:hypothetical protein